MRDRTWRPAARAAVAARGAVGQALAEFAIILVVLMLILLGIVDLSRAVYIRSVVANAAREGARFAAVDRAASEEQILASVKALTAGLDTDKIGVKVVSTSAEVSIVVTYTFHPATALIAQAAGIGPGGVVLHGSSKMRREP